jgi:hypothetical protein
MPRSVSFARTHLTSQQFRLAAGGDVHPPPQQGLPARCVLRRRLLLRAPRHAERRARPETFEGAVRPASAQSWRRTALRRARSLSAALDEEKRSRCRCSSISANANAGKRALVREVSMPRSLHTPTPKGESAMKAHPPLRWRSRGRPTHACRRTPMKREKPDRPGDLVASGQDNAFGAPMSRLLRRVDADQDKM